MALLHFDRDVFRHLHWGLLSCALGLSLIGIAAIASSESPAEHHALRQSVWVAAGLIAFVFAVAVDPPWLRWLAPAIYLLLLISLAGLLVAGHSAKGATSWYDLGPARIQPSEFMKIAVVLLLANLATRRPNAWERLVPLLVALAVAGLPVAVIFLQPDLGTAAVFVPVVLVILLLGGARLAHLFALGLAGLALLAVLYQSLAPYQRDRIQSFLSPGEDARGRDYNIIQARISLGSGQLWGRAFQSDDEYEEDPLAPETPFSRGRLDFLPEAHTDFIFNALGEQFGFAGCAAVIALYGVMAGFAVVIAVQAPTLQWALVVAGLLAILMTHVFLNLGMALRLLPVTGLPLPFLSYGGSAMLANYIALGLIANVAARRTVAQPSRI